MIEVKITGNSIPELADKLMAMGRALHVQASYEETRAKVEKEADAIIEKSEATATAKRSRKKAEQAAATVTVVEDEPAEQVDTDTGEVAEVPALETVTAAVLSAVERVGRDKVVAILAQFGVNRASEVAPAQRAELLAMVKDA